MSQDKKQQRAKLKTEHPLAISSFEQALGYHLQGDLTGAERLYRELLNDDPTHSDAQYYLGTLLAQLGKIDAAKIWFKKVLHENPEQAQYWLTYAESHLLTGQPDEALQVLDQAKTSGVDGTAFVVLRDKVEIALAQQPDLAGVEKLISQGQLREALEFIQEQINFLGLRVEFLAPMGEIFLLQEDFEKSMYYSEKACTRQPTIWISWNLRGCAFAKIGDNKNAYSCLQQALRLNPGNKDVLTNLASNYADARLYEKALECVHPLLKAEPNLIRPRIILARSLIGLGRVKEALQVFEGLIKEGHSMEAIYRGYANALQRIPDLESAIRVLHEGKRIFPGLSESLIPLMAYDPLSTPDMVKQEAILYGEILARKTSSVFQHWHLPTEGEPLRVGFVSADLGLHPVGRYLVGILGYLSRQKIELFAYSAVDRKDHLATKLRALFNHWHIIEGIPDAQAAQIIRDDRIQILIDLGGHTLSNRLALFQRRPAPVQATWLGFPSTTGVKNIDYILGDSYVTPPEEEHHFTEKVWRISDFFIYFAEPDLGLQVNELPALTSKSFTFGCLNNLMKISDQAVSVWSKILHALPHARLLLKSAGLDKDVNQIKLIQNRFFEYGVGAERLIFEEFYVNRLDFIASYHRVDIALDPFPFPGATTSLESLWMGVPVLTLRGKSFASHLGDAIASATGLSDWIAEDQEDYVEKACRFAKEVEKLAALRSNLRGQLLASPICNAPLFAENFGKSMWAMWQQYLDINEQTNAQKS
tara:strand:- start:1426 stop:3705 length:2280 start_codon:yes stop_codon:yes gene_type:complete